jgi:hypothetical protein
MIDSIRWSNILSPAGNTNFILIILKNDRVPIVFHAQIDIMESWYDGFRLVHSHSPPETSSSNARREIFRKAIALASVKRPMIIAIPPPPTNYEFCAQSPPN